jgi:hypothetical protein
MNVIWRCPNCEKTVKTDSRVCRVAHLHGKEETELTPYKKPMKQRGVDTIKSLKKEVWDLFSEYIRRSEADKDEYCVCVTCGYRDHWKGMQAGHYIHGTSFLIPELVHPQCPQCNGFKAGMAIEYKEFMLKIYGQRFLDKLEYQARRSTKLSIFELRTYKKLYTEKLSNLRG